MRVLHFTKSNIEIVYRLVSTSDAMKNKRPYSSSVHIYTLFL
jgi:hypothetical protein